MIIEIVVSSKNQMNQNDEKAKQLVKKVLQDFPQATLGQIDSSVESERVRSLGFVGSGAIVINGNLAFKNLPKEKNLRELLKTLNVMN